MQSRLCSRVVRAAGALLAALLLVVPVLEAQQTGTVTGRVTDAQNGQPVSSVQVYVQGLDLGVLTQQNGRFLLQNVPSGTHTLTAERIGYRTATQEVSVSGGSTVVQDFTLSEEALQLDAVVVTGTPGGTQRRALGNSVAQVEATDITERATITNMQDLLSARAPGLNFQRTSGNVGAGSQIQIRGVSSLELGAQPLIYVDGVRVNNDATRGPALGRSAGEATSLDDFNPQDIESIEIIKGPAAATLYGTEASAGVIQIITKRGQTGAPEFNFTMRQGANFMVDPGGRIGPKYACAPGGTLGAAQGFACQEESVITYDAYEIANQWVQETGWQGREDLFRYGQTQGYNLSIRGGTDQIRYFLSGDYSDDEGIVDWNWNEALRLRGNISVVASENLTFDVSTGFTQGETRFATPVPGEGGVWHDLLWTRYNPETSPGPASVFNDRLPTATERAASIRDFSRFTGSVTATHTYGDWLTQRLIMGVDRAWDTNSRLIPRDPEGNYSASETGEIFYGRPNTQDLTFDYAASGFYDVNDALRLTTSVGAQYYTNHEEEVTNTGRGFVTGTQSTVNQTAPEQLSLTFSDVENKSLGVYVQEEIGWNDRLFLTGAIRADDNSAFGSEFDLEYYPKVSGAWVVSEESFWNLEPVNSLRLRAAWGKAGRQPSTFAGLTTYQTYPGPGGTGLTPDNPGNALIGPEVSTEIEVGFDLAFLNDRISGEFTYFDQTVEDALVDEALAPSLGIPGTADYNLGELSNTGWEASLNARIYEADNVAFDLAASGDHSINEIVSLGEGILESANFQLGFPYPNVTGTYVVSADLVDQGVYANAMCDAGTADGRPGGEAIPCDDLSGFQDNLLYGPAYPTYTFSVAPTLILFNDLQLFALAEGEYGRWVANIDTQYSGVYRNTPPSRIRNDPLYLAAQSVGDERYSGRVPGDHWKLRELGARYNLPESLVQRSGADRASLSVTARNLWVLWQKAETDLGGQKIYDIEDAGPTTAAANVALWSMPSISSLSATLRVTF